MKFKLLMVIVVCGMLAGPAAFGQSISIDSVTNLWPGNENSSDTNKIVTFWVRITNDGVRSYDGITNGFQVHSEDGAEWTTTDMDTIGTLGKTQFDLVFALSTYSIDGMGADTVGFGGSRMLAGGLPADFDTIAYKIEIGPIDEAHIGKEICIDSCFYPPSGLWKWGASGGITVFPAWDGPHCYVIATDQVGVETLEDDNLPQSFSLGQNYPNPFNPVTEIAFDLPAKTHVTLSVYNVLGQKVSTLVNEDLSAGSYVTDWDGTSDGGTSVASGIYFYRIETDKNVETKKMVLLK